MPCMARFSSRNRPAPRRPAGVGAGVGAGAWHRRRRQGRVGSPYDEIDSREGTWLSLSLDIDGEETGPARLQDSRTPLPTRTPPQPPPLDESPAGDSSASNLNALPTPDDPGEPSVVVEIEDSQYGEVALVPTTDHGTSFSGSLDSESLDKASNSGVSEAAGALGGPLPEEDTEAVQVPLPAPIPVTLSDEILPWPPMLVAPTLVLPGAWPPPLGTLAQSSPSVLDLQPEEDSRHLQEVSMDGLPANSGSGRASLSEGDNALEPSLSVEVVIEDDSVADVSIVERLSPPQPLSPPSVYGDRIPTEEDGQAGEDASTDALVEDSSVTAEDLAGEASAPAALRDAPPNDKHRGRSAGDDDVPTQVSERDALEEALAVLRTVEPGTLLASMPDTEEDGEESEVTAEDLVSLELVDEELQVDPEVRSDMDLAPVPTPRWDRTWLGTGAPTLASTPAPTRAFIELRLTAVPSRPSDAAAMSRGVPGRDELGRVGTDLRELADRPDAEETDDDWLADLPDV